MRARCLPFLFLALLVGCERKLPGPEECRAFALASVGIEPGTPAGLIARSPIGMRAEELTRQCLTQPWDYKLLTCLQTVRSSQLCMMRFEQRRLGAHVE